MKKLRWLFTFLLTALLFTSCQQDDLKTDLEMIQEELEQFMDDNNIVRVNVLLVRNGVRTTQHSETTFFIEDGYVIIQDDGITNKYNLLFLSRYELTRNGQGAFRVNLYFESKA